MARGPIYQAGQRRSRGRFPSAKFASTRHVASKSTPPSWPLGCPECRPPEGCLVTLLSPEVTQPGARPCEGDSALSAPAPPRYATRMNQSPALLSAVQPAPAPARILGVDPGLQVTGYAVVEARPRAPHVCEAGIIRTKAGRTTTDVALRVRVLYDGIVEVLEQFRPEVMVVEQLFAHYDHPRTAILMAHARGVLLLAAAQRNVPVVHYAASRIKKTITGSGRASKEQMQRAMQRELNLPRLPEPPDVADAQIGRAHV